MRIERVFSPINDFRNYRKSWGWLNSAHIINTLGHPRLRENYASQRERLTQRSIPTFLRPILKCDQRGGISLSRRSIRKSLILASFDFAGKLLLLVVFSTKLTVKSKIIILLWVLQNAEVAYMEKADFMRECQSRAIPLRKFQHVDVYLRLREYRSERERFRLTQTRRIGEQFTDDNYRQLHTLKGFKIDGEFSRN